MQLQCKLLGWSAKRELAKINYRIHTDAIKINLISTELTAQQTSVIYVSEADVYFGNADNNSTKIVLFPPNSEKLKS